MIGSIDYFTANELAYVFKSANFFYKTVLDFKKEIE